MNIADWTTTDAAETLAFFDTKAGAKFLGALRALRPPLPLDVEQAHNFARQAGCAQGYEHALFMMEFILTPKFFEDPSPRTEQYPDIDDETQWTKES